MKTKRVLVEVKSERDGHDELGIWVNYGALYAHCPFCDDQGYYEPEAESARDKYVVCSHFQKSEDLMATFEGPADEWNGEGYDVTPDAPSLFELGKDLVRLNARGIK